MSWSLQILVVEVVRLVRIATMIVPIIYAVPFLLLERLIAGLPRDGM
jgi:hypothetical protein